MPPLDSAAAASKIAPVIGPSAYGCRNAKPRNRFDACSWRLAARSGDGAGGGSFARLPERGLHLRDCLCGEDAGLFAKHGLKLKPLVVTGPGSTNAVISGSADFAL